MNETSTPSEAQPYHLSRQAREAEAVLDRITDEFEDNPRGMDYFYDLFRRVYCKGESLLLDSPL